MKEKFCEICKKTYKINYFYTHKKSKLHKTNELKKSKTILLNEDNNDEKRYIKVVLEDLKNKIDDILKKI